MWNPYFNCSNFGSLIPYCDIILQEICFHKRFNIWFWNYHFSILFLFEFLTTDSAKLPHSTQFNKKSSHLAVNPQSIPTIYHQFISMVYFDKLFTVPRETTVDLFSPDLNTTCIFHFFIKIIFFIIKGIVRMTCQTNDEV